MNISWLHTLTTMRITPQICCCVSPASLALETNSKKKLIPSVSQLGGLPLTRGYQQAVTRMERALEIAESTPAGDIPVGAVIYGPDGEELATGVNRREQLADPTAHAEVEAIRAAVREHGDSWRLEECELVVTLEPCAMCAGAAQAARIGSVVFGAWEPKTGACGSLVDVLRAPGALFVPEVRAGVSEAQCQELLRDFFQNLQIGRAHV